MTQPVLYNEAASRHMLFVRFTKMFLKRNLLNCAGA